MRIPYVVPRRAGEPIIPLVNVVFLLLVFVLLTATFEPSQPFKVTLPKSAVAVPDEHGPPVILLGRNGELAFEGQVVDLATLQTRLHAGPTPAVVLKADAGATAGQLLILARSLRSVGVSRIEMLTIGR